MQRKTKKIYDIISIIINVILFLFMILSIITKNNNFYAWYWTCVSVMLLCEVLYIHKWDKVDGIDVKKNKSKMIRSSFDGITTGTIMISGLLYLSVMGLEMINKSIKDNIYVIILTYIMLTISLISNLLAIYSANKDTKELAEKIFNYKK